MKVTRMVAKVKQPAKMYQESSSKTSVKAGTLSYTLLTMLMVASYLRCACVDMVVVVVVVRRYKERDEKWGSETEKKKKRKKREYECQFLWW